MSDKPNPEAGKPPAKDAKDAKGPKGDKGDDGGLEMDVIELEDLPAAKGGRCAHLFLVVSGKGFAAVRCGRPAKAGGALCELHSIHVGTA